LHFNMFQPPIYLFGWFRGGCLKFWISKIHQNPMKSKWHTEQLMLRYASFSCAPKRVAQHFHLHGMPPKGFATPRSVGAVASVPPYGFFLMRHPKIIQNMGQNPGTLLFTPKWTSSYGCSSLPNLWKIIEF
jgi:hypothetical protein